MSRHKEFRIKFSSFLGSYRGKTIFNFFYGFGASLAILGTMFKFLHLSFGNEMLIIGLGTEAVIFAIFSFEPPFRNYHWERIFPELDTEEEENLSETSRENGNKIKTVVNQPNKSTATSVQEPEVINVFSGHVSPTSNITPDQARANYGIAPQVPLSPEESQTLANSIKRMGEAVNQLNNLADVSVITEKYLNQLSGMTDNLGRFSDATGSLAEVSNILLNSYRHITENSDDISNNSKGYVEQMGNLNRNLMGLNTIYEIQLKSISSQIDTIDRVNKGMIHIKEMYEGSITDSERFNKETEGLADNLAKLNKVYARMLEAMTSNVVLGGFNPGNGSETPKES